MSGGDEVLWEDWHRIDALLEQALDRPEEERDAFLQAACADEPGLLRELRAILAGGEGGDFTLKGPGRDLLEAAFPPPVDSIPALGPGERVGPYRVLREAGRGGMATVYEAERADGAFQRRVAIKVLRRGLDTEDIVSRFLSERQILSTLVHPHIALLLDGGATADGRPFLVMELVPGKPVTEWAADSDPPVPERIRVFLQVADAVAFAHRRLVIHRDIKPLNVLVDRDGQAKLLDFGIARIVEPDAEATSLTRGVFLTPAYASPEQAAGRPMTTASDIYQLGILLRETLAAGASGEAPSGDLGRVLDKAVREEPEERYPSAEAFAADLRAVLEIRPVSARPASAAYRLRKLARRNPWLVPGVVAAAVLSLGYVGTLTVQARRLERERDRATEAAERAAALRSLLVGQFAAADPYGSDPGMARDVTMVEALDRALERARTELQGQTLLLAGILSDVAAVRANLDLREPALALLEEAMALRASADEALTPDQLDDLSLSADLVARLGMPDSALSLARRRLELERSLRPMDPAREADALSRVAGAEMAAGRPGIARDLLVESVGLLRGAPAAHEPALATMLETLADAERRVENLAAAEAAIREALEIRRRLHPPEHPAVATAEIHLAQLLDAAGRLDEAVATYRAALPDLEASLGPAHFITQASWNNLGNVLMARGDLAGAEEVHRRILAERRARLGAVPHADVAASLQNLAVVLVRQGRLDEADSLAAEAGRINAQVHGPRFYGVAIPLLTRTEIRLIRSEGAEAERFARQAVEILVETLPREHSVVAAAECRLAAAMGLQGGQAAAETLAGSALQRLEASPSSPERLVTECRAALERIRSGV